MRSERPITRVYSKEQGESWVSRTSLHGDTLPSDLPTGRNTKPKHFTAKVRQCNSAALYTYVKHLHTVQRTESSHQNNPKHPRGTVHAICTSATTSRLPQTPSRSANPSPLERARDHDQKTTAKDKGPHCSWNYKKATHWQSITSKTTGWHKPCKHSVLMTRWLMVHPNSLHYQIISDRDVFSSDDLWGGKWTKMT